MSKKTPTESQTFDEAREQIHRQMLSAVSHDLKTPLATIIGSLEIYLRMEEKLTPEKRKSLINSALTEGYRLDNFITNILDMAKLEGHMVKINSERCDLTTMLQDCLIRLGPKREKGKIRLSPKGTGSIVYTDPMLLGRATGLVLENALTHSGKQPLIDIQYGIDGDNAIIQVQDNGPGIPKGQENNIFSKYARLEKRDQQNAGTGLGLSICREIMKTLSGTVTAENNETGGAQFLLTFPVH